MTTAEDSIRARRRLTNKFIAAHAANRLRPFFQPDLKVIAGDGTLIVGVDRVLDAFLTQFQDPLFEAYVRTSETVHVDDDGGRAAETGRWVGLWRDGSSTSGPYLAAWRRCVGQWVIESELFITLTQTVPEALSRR